MITRFKLLNALHDMHLLAYDDFLTNMNFTNFDYYLILKNDSKPHWLNIGIVNEIILTDKSQVFLPGYRNSIFKIRNMLDFFEQNNTHLPFMVFKVNKIQHNQQIIDCLQRYITSIQQLDILFKQCIMPVTTTEQYNFIQMLKQNVPLHKSCFIEAMICAIKSVLSLWKIIELINRKTATEEIKNLTDLPKIKTIANNIQKTFVDHYLYEAKDGSVYSLKYNTVRWTLSVMESTTDVLHDIVAQYQRYAINIMYTIFNTIKIHIPILNIFNLLIFGLLLIIAGPILIPIAFILYIFRLLMLTFLVIMKRSIDMTCYLLFE